VALLARGFCDRASNVETRVTFESGNVKAEAMLDGTPLGSPIHIDGAYYTIREAKILSERINTAVLSALTTQAEYHLKKNA
jgi:hypothetical protein